MAEAAFPEVDRIRFEGPDSKNPLAFRHYNANEMVEGKSMKDQLRFTVAYWHTFRGTGSDPFGPGTMLRPWEVGTDSVENAVQARPRGLRVHREARRPLLLLPRPRRRPRRRQALPRPTTISTRSSRSIKEEMQRTGIKLLWGTANLFSNPRYMHGAATSPNADAFAYAAAQVKKALEVTKELGGAELRLLGRPRGLPDPLEHRHETRARPPRPRSSTWPSSTRRRSASPASSLRAQAQGADQPPVRLRRRRLHHLPARLRPGRPLQAEPRDQPRHPGRPHHEHELDYAGRQGFLGSIDANRGDLLLGWDTDQFPTDFYLTTQMHAGASSSTAADPRRRQLRRQGPPRELRADRSVPRPHRRHGRLRPRPEDRRPDPPGRRAREDGQATATARGTRASARRSRKASTTSTSWRSTCSTRAT